MKSNRWFDRTSMRILAGIIAFQLSLPMPVNAAVMSLAQVPLAKTSSTTVLPNLMFILDNSGSMNFDYLPDYIIDANTCKTDPNVAELVLESASNAQVNAVRIVPGGSCTVSVANLISGTTSASSTTGTVASRIDALEVAGDGWDIVRSGSTLTVSTTNFTAAQLEGCSVQLNVSSGTLSPTSATFGRKACARGDPPFHSPDFNRIFYNPEVLYAPGVNADQSFKTSQTNLAAVENNPYVSGAGTTNLGTSYPERVWCDTTTPTATDISNATSTSDNCRVSTIDYEYPNQFYKYPQTRSAQPYYFRANVIAYCSDARLTTCIQASAPSGAFTFPARVRFCKVGNTSDCQEKQNPVTGYTEPNYLSIAVPKAASGRIDVTAVSEGLSISTIPVNGVDVIAGNAIVATSTDTTNTFATKIVNQINATLTTPEYRACIGTPDGNNGCSGTPANRVSIYPQVATGSTTVLTGSSANGRTVSTTSPALLNTRAKWTITFGTGRTPIRITSITIGGTNILSGGPYNATTGVDTSAKRQALATAIAGAVNLGGYTAVVDPTNSERVVVTAPAGTGIAENSKALAITGSRSSSGSVTLGSSGSNTSVTLRIVDGATNITNNTIAATGTNDAGEADALAAAMAANATNSYTAVASGNVLTAYTPLGSTSTATPSSVQTPAAVAAVAPTATYSVSMGGSGTAWRVDAMSISTGGSCVYSDGNVLLGAGPGGATGAAAFASQVVSMNDTSDGINITNPTTTSVRLTGFNNATLNGCRITVSATRTAGTGTLTLGGVVSSGGSFTFSNIATFAGGVTAVPAVVTGATAFSGGYANAAMAASDVTMARTTDGTTQGPVTVSTGDFANGTDSVKTFQRCDIKSDQNCVDGSDNFVGNNGTVTGGRFPKSAARTDCAGATFCTYDEEKTNFANWYAYYRTRLLSMKTAAGTAFASLGNNFRVGFVTIGNWNQADGATDFLKVGAFSGTHRSDWYDTLYRQDAPNATPLRHALSTVGRYFAGEPVFASFNAPDPMQYSCQNNYTLLTTDGYWNEVWDTNIRKADGTVMDNADSGPGVPRPFNDGGLGGTCGVGSGQPTQFSSCGTLADVAYHFYETDLRVTGGAHCLGEAVAGVQHDVCTNNAGTDNQQPQRMITYTLGLGVDGTLEFQDNYAQLIDGTDFKKINDGVLNWPQAQNLHPTAVDDLWHAAVNGRGQYFSARNPQTLTRSLRNALSLIAAETGSGAAAATSNLEPTAEDNFAYVASYQTQTWKGNLESRTINITTGSVSTTAGWCVEDVRSATNDLVCTGTLKSKVAADSDTRTIYMRKAGATNALGQTTDLGVFKYDQLSATQKTYFDPTLLVQYPTLSAPAKAAATGASLVDYLRGQTGFEDEDTNALRLYRDRQATMADPVGSQPVFVGKPRFGYADPGYAGFKSAQSARASAIYIGTNGGMVHSFDATNGSERWAYVPSPVMPNMWELADFNYANLHRYFVDGSPVAGDVCVSNCTDSAAAVWKTIVVGGYNAGAKGYFALDVTDPANPKSLWELADVDMGYSFGNPLITKRRNSDGSTRWVVLLTSGYNNISTGHGYLYVVDVATGAILNKIDTGVGSSTTPSGLAKIEAFVEDRETANLTTHVYGGDILGNVWRFNIDQASPGVVKIATLKDPSGGGQPITTRPLLTKLDDTSQTRYIVVGTGKLLETADMTDPQVQSLYGFVDRYDDTAATVGNCAGCSHGARDQLTQQTLVDVAGTNNRTSGTTSIEPAPAIKVDGCMVDFPLTREKMNIDARLVRGVVSAVTNVPGNDACVDGGVSYISFFDYKTCRALESYKVRGAMGAGQIVIKTTGGFVTLVTVSDSPTPVVAGSVPPYSGTSRSFEGRRVGWRVLFD